MKTFTLSNKNGMEMTVTNYGCAIITLKIPAKNGMVDVVLGLDSAEDYQKKAHPFFGVVAGRVANRIGKGRFTLDGKEYQLETNNDANHLHGGSNGFDKQLWNVIEVTGDKIVFEYESPDGDSGYPGDLTARVVYTLTDENVLRIDYYITTKSKTIANLTNHSYFNLCGHDAPNIYDTVMQIFSDKTTAVDTEIIPTGDYVDIAGTPFDFNTPKKLGQDLEAAGNVNNTGGYDHNYVLRSPGVAAIAFSEKTGIKMEVRTNSPGMQLYSGNFIDGTISGKGVTYKKHSGFCLETQIFPDAINHPNFPSCIVTSEQPQEFFTEFCFSWT